MGSNGIGVIELLLLLLPKLLAADRVALSLALSSVSAVKPVAEPCPCSPRPGGVHVTQCQVWSLIEPQYYPPLSSLPAVSLCHVQQRTSLAKW